jgi:predicted ATPase/class 3 adenylate cyclase
MRDGPLMTLTFLFTDIEGSTRQWEELPEMSNRVDEHFALLDAAVVAMGGEIFARMGDGIAAAFPSAEAAIYAAVDAQRQMPMTGLQVRMGIHTGEVERVGDDFRGRPVNRAARIMAAGHGGQILVSDVSASLVRGGFCPPELVDVGRHRLRDLVEPERLWQVLHPDLGRRFAAVRGLDTYANNLPTQRSSLIGRERDVARVVELVEHQRIVTLTGVGGVGKTRLAVQAAADLVVSFANVWFIELANVADPDDVADAIAITMGAGAVPDPLAAIRALVAGGRTLLVIDNCEHVIDSAASVVDTLTAACPGLSVIVTSREALGVEGEHVFAVRTLDRSMAAELFGQRAQAASADLTTLDRALIEHICVRLDGIPLAIELAAARAATLGLPAVVAALDDRFSVLSGGRRRAADRHSTMRATIDWSYRLLDDGERQLFAWLAVFSGGFELDAARHIAGALGIAAPAATDYVDSLAHKSMIAPETHERGVRYRMLETMRAFALEQLDLRNERTVAASAQAEWVATLTDLPVEDPCCAAVERHSIRLERESDNWREAAMFAARIGSGDLAGRLCGPPAAFFLLGRHDLADFVLPLLERCAAGSSARRSVLTALVVSAGGATSADQMRAWADEVHAIDGAQPTGLGGLMQWLALAWGGDFDASIDVCVAAADDVRLSTATRDLFIGIATLDHFSLTEATQDSRRLIDRALEVAARCEMSLARAVSLLGAAWAAADSEPDRALDLVRRALQDIPNVPALTRLTLPGSASRLLARLDPRVAAQGLLGQIDGTPARRSFVDLIPVFYALSLLHRVGHPVADVALGSLSLSASPHLSMMDFIDMARRAASCGNQLSLNELETMVCAALREIAAVSEPIGVGNVL